jgi:hypothetical protein
MMDGCGSDTMTRMKSRMMRNRPIWQYNPKEEDPVPFKADYLHRGCVQYDPRKLLKKLFMEAERKKKND